MVSLPRPLAAVWLSTLAVTAGVEAPWPPEGARLVRLQFEGGQEDDTRFAELALGLTAGDRVDGPQWATALTAIMATDRFESVTPSLTHTPEGIQAVVHLHPWPRTVQFSWEGLPAGFSAHIPRDLRRGIPLGPLRLAEACDRLQDRLRAWGYPEATVRFERRNQKQQVVLVAQAGTPRLIKKVRCTGDLGPYSESQIRKALGITEGTTLWHEATRLEALSRLRKHFVSDDRLEGHADLQWEADSGTLLVGLRVGPRVTVVREGSGLSNRRMRALLPILKADRYSPDLADEGDRALLRVLLGEGHLDAAVAHRWEPRDQGRTKALVYQLQPGPAYTLAGFRVEKNAELSLADLRREVTVPRTWVVVGDPKASPDSLDLLEERILAAYWRRGFVEASLRRLAMERAGQQATAVFQVNEGPRRLISTLQLELPAGIFRQPGPLGAALGMYLQDRVDGLVPGPTPRVVRADRSSAPARQGTLVALPQSGDGPQRFELRFDQPTPLVKAELARVLSHLRLRLFAEGIQRPEPRLMLDDQGEADTLRIVVGPQERVQTRRLVVRGAGQTRAKAVVRETVIRPGEPLDPDRMTRSQANLANLGGFERVDLMPLQEEPPPTTEGLWREGDVLAKLQERSPWVISHSFGYDRGQGYHVGLGVQRLNVGGMGRTLDLGIRAGDGTLKDPFLRKVFPTGSNPRSVDMYSLGYSDPWLLAGPYGHWLPDRSQYRAEAAAIHEQRDTYLVRRQRVLNSLEWRTDGALAIQGGLRYERVRVRSAIEGISDAELNQTTRIPGQATIVAPWFQVLRDRRDNPLDPLEGSFASLRLEMANQVWGTTANSSFVKLDLRFQRHWAIGYRASHGVFSMNVRIGAAIPTARSARELPLSERFFAGGPFSHRGVEPDWLGPQGSVPVRDAFPPYTQKVDEQGKPIFQPVPLGGQALTLANLEYRFPTYFRGIWGEVFLDSGQVQKTFYPEAGEARFSPLRTALGLGIILKVGMPIKAEFAWDVKRLLGRPRRPEERDTELKKLLLSAGFQF